MDELQAIDELRARHGPIFLRRPGVVYVADPATATAILTDTDGRYREHSDLFHTSKGTFGPREAQRDVGVAVRDLLLDHWTRMAATPVPHELVSRWPDTGNLLLYTSFRDVLVPPGELRPLVDQVVRHTVLRDRRMPMTELRTRVRRALVAELSRRRGGGEGRTLLDILAGVAPGGSSYTALVQLSELYLSFVYAVAGWLGFALGWSVYLVGTNPDTAGRPADVVREALRLWPVRWHLNRRPAEPHQLGEVPVAPSDEVVVCPYLVHRDENHWPDPETFQPSRWAGTTSAPEAFLPFGSGPRACVVADLAVDIAADVLRLLPDHWKIEPHEDRPHISAVLAPPGFTLRLA